MPTERAPVEDFERKTIAERAKKTLRAVAASIGMPGSEPENASSGAPLEPAPPAAKSNVRPRREAALPPSGQRPARKRRAANTCSHAFWRI